MTTSCFTILLGKPLKDLRTEKIEDDYINKSVQSNHLSTHVSDEHDIIKGALFIDSNFEFGGGSIFVEINKE